MSTTDEQSVHLSRVLDSIGYNRHMVEVRKNNKKYDEELFENWTVPPLPPGSVIVAGSQGEGLGKFLIDDEDYLYFEPDVICLNEVPVYSVVPIVFLTHDTEPGYCLLELPSNQFKILEYRIIHSSFHDSLIKYKGQVYLSSRDFRESCHHAYACDSAKDLLPFSQITGPASTHKGESIGISTDIVTTLFCKCPAIMEQWLKRHQKYVWPSSSSRKEISKMRANLVATGMKGSSTEDLEWRYCFNELEMILVNNLNDTQQQLYVILKMINKDILAKKGFTLSSFMWKNIVFWTAEEHEQRYFRPENLYKLVVECLERMKLAARENNLPYYMIAERNLFKEKVNTSDRLRLQETLSDMIQQGQTITINSTRLGKFMQLNLDELRLFDKKNVWFEMLIARPRDMYTIRGNFLEFVIIMSGLPPSIEEDIMKCKDWHAVRRVMLVAGAE